MKTKFALLAAVAVSIPMSARAETPKMELFDHNGSQMSVEYAYDAIRYMFPKESLRGIIDRNQVVFTGTIHYRGTAEGTGYVYKKGCDWAEYPVKGHYDSSIPGFVLTGAAPVREKGGCKVIGYSKKSPNARLVFVDVEEQSRRQQEADVDSVYYEEGGEDWAAGFKDGDGKVGKAQN